MRNQTWLIAVLISINLATLVYCYQRTNKLGKDGFVDVIQLVNNYKLKADLSKKIDGRIKMDQNLVDSLNLRVHLAKANSEEQKVANENLLAARYQYENDLERFNHSITEQVWNRLNPLIYEFSRENKISLLVGATGTGNVLYGDSTIDYTAKLIKYVNAKYEGK